MSPPILVWRTLTHWSVFTTAAGLIIGAAIGLSPQAQATPPEDYAAVEWPVICGVLDGAPHLATLDNLAAVIMRDTGWSAYDAGYAIGSAVLRYCPEHAALIDRYVQIYRPKGRAIA